MGLASRDYSGDGESITVNRAKVTFYERICKLCSKAYWVRQGDKRKHCGCGHQRPCLRLKAEERRLRFLKANAQLLRGLNEENIGAASKAARSSTDRI